MLSLANVRDALASKGLSVSRRGRDYFVSDSHGVIYITDDLDDAHFFGVKHGVRR